MAPTSKNRDSQATRNYTDRPVVPWPKLYEGCILFLRDKASVDRHIPSLTNGLRTEEEWVYDHPCVVLSVCKHPTKGQIVRVAPITAHPPVGRMASFIPINPSGGLNGNQVSLRQDRKLDKASYLKKVCFEVDFRLLALYNGASPDYYRLTKASMKTVLAQMPKVIEWAPPRPVSAPPPVMPLPNVRGSVHRSLPHACISSDLLQGLNDIDWINVPRTSCPSPVHPSTQASRPDYTTKPLVRTSVGDLEAQPLLSGPKLSGHRLTGDEASIQRPMNVVRFVLKLVLCAPMLVAAGCCLVAKFVWSMLARGPVATYDALVKLSIALCKNNLENLGGSC